MMRRRPGFTLMEVLVVLSVAALILVLLGQGIRLGLRGTDSYHAAVQPQADMEPVERALRHMIEHMDPGHYPDPTVVVGTAHSLAFATEIPDPRTQGTMTADVRLELDGGRLVLWWRRTGNGVPFGGSEPMNRTVLLDAVTGLDVAYAGRWTGAAWLPAWSDPAMPGLVRIGIRRGGTAWPPIVARPWREQAEE